LFNLLLRAVSDFYTEKPDRGDSQAEFCLKFYGAKKEIPSADVTNS